MCSAKGGIFSARLTGSSQAPFSLLQMMLLEEQLQAVVQPGPQRPSGHTRNTQKSIVGQTHTHIHNGQIHTSKQTSMHANKRAHTQNIIPCQRVASYSTQRRHAATKTTTDTRLCSIFRYIRQTPVVSMVGGEGRGRRDEFSVILGQLIISNRIIHEGLLEIISNCFLPFPPLHYHFSCYWELSWRCRFSLKKSNPKKYSLRTMTSEMTTQYKQWIKLIL